MPVSPDVLAGLRVRGVQHSLRFAPEYQTPRCRQHTGHYRPLRFDFPRLCGRGGVPAAIGKRVSASAAREMFRAISIVLLVVLLRLVIRCPSCGAGGHPRIPLDVPASV